MYRAAAPEILNFVLWGGLRYRMAAPEFLNLVLRGRFVFRTAAPEVLILVLWVGFVHSSCPGDFVYRTVALPLRFGTSTYGVDLCSGRLSLRF